MKTLKSISLLATISVSFAMSLTATACQPGNGGNNGEDVYICVYDGGYGTEWIETIANNYEKETGIHVEWDADESLLDRIQDQVKNTSDYDIFMSHDINWQSFAAEGLLYNLDELYDSEVEGTGKTFAERNLPQNLNYSRSEGPDGESHYYKVCYTAGAGGLVYNVDLFKKHGWSVPTTYDELLDLCNLIIDAKIDVGNRQTLVPFSWSGSDRQYYWDYIVFEWWAQLAGLDKIDDVVKYLGPDTEGNLNKYSNGYEMYNPDTYYKEFNQAYEMWYNLVKENPNFSNAGAQGTNLASAQSLFANGKAAMIPYAQWAKLEISNSLGDGKELPFDIAIMNTPKAVETAPDVNYLVGYGDSMIIPANATNPEGAVDFLRYMARYDVCATFVEKSNGAFLAFDYSDVDLTNLTENDIYVKSIYDRLTKNKCFTLASMNPITYWNVNCVMPWISNVYYYASAMAGDKEAAPENVAKTMYDTAKTAWPAWLRNAGLPLND